MSRIEPARLSRILSSLTAPKGKASSSAQPEGAGALSKRESRNISALRANLKKRLSKLRLSSEDFDSAAPIVLVQEILRWEFGSEIVEHIAFEKATQAISEAMVSSPQAQASVARLIKELSESE